MYKGHPLMRKDNFIYYGSMADKYIIMMQILETKKIKDLDVASKVSVSLQHTDPTSSPRIVWLKRAKRTAFGTPLISP